MASFVSKLRSDITARCLEDRPFNNLLTHASLPMALLVALEKNIECEFWKITIGSNFAQCLEAASLESKARNRAFLFLFQSDLAQKQLILVFPSYQFDSSDDSPYNKDLSIYQ